MCRWHSAFAFSILYMRGMSANLLSIGAVDFGIIVDSSVIMVENIYRHLSSGEYAELSLNERILKATHEVERGLFFTTAIMVCAFVPLFTMQGPEGQIFGPMADTYAFALCGALFLALTMAPVMCLLCFKNLKPAPDNWLVRGMKARYLRNLRFCLRHPLRDGRRDGGAHDLHHGMMLAPLGSRIHARAGRGQPVDSRDRSAQYLARAAHAALGPGAGHHGHVSRGRVDREPARPTRRRDRYRRLLQQRILRPAATGERLAPAGRASEMVRLPAHLRHHAGADQGRNRRRDEHRAE